MNEVRMLRPCSTTPGEPAKQLTLRDGEFVAPITLGSEGDFVLRGPGCHAQHGKAYFDGHTLFIASSDPAAPVLANSTPLGTGWTAVPCPSLLELGGAQLAYDFAERALPPVTADPRGEWEVKTTIGAPPWREPEMAAETVPQPGSRRFDASDAGLATLVGPMPVLRPAPTSTSTSNNDFSAVTIVSQARPLFAASTAATQPAPSDAPTAPTLPLAPTPDAKPTPKPSALRALFARARDDFRRAPRSVRMIFIALPAIAYVVLNFGNPSEAADPPRARPKTSLNAAKPASAPRPTPSADSAPSGATAVAFDDTRAAPARDALANRAGSNRALALDDNGKLTLEARAANAAARGAYGEAAAIYEELATRHPNRTEFASAARILRAKQQP